MVLYIAAQISIDSTLKFIIFVQYSKLATLVTQALLQYKINAVNLAGTVSSRTGTLDKFQKPERCLDSIYILHSHKGHMYLALMKFVALHP